MAVVAMWKCDRDESMFSSKKDAEAHDKLLELAEQFSAVLMSVIPEVDFHRAEEFGLFMARNKEVVMEACKGKSEILSTIHVMKDSNVRPLVAEAS